MQIILSDQNCEGHARAIFDVVKYRGYLEWIPMELKMFEEVGLRRKADDETVWRFCQEKKLTYSMKFIKTYHPHEEEHN